MLGWTGLTLAVIVLRAVVAAWYCLWVMFWIIPLIALPWRIVRRGQRRRERWQQDMLSEARRDRPDR